MKSIVIIAELYSMKILIPSQKDCIQSRMDKYKLNLEEGFYSKKLDDNRQSLGVNLSQWPFWLETIRGRRCDSDISD